MQNFGRYQVDGELGRGGCGVVYSATDPRIGRRVAIKTIDSEGSGTDGDSLRERFRREARAAGILSHPNIVTIHEFDDSGDVLYIVMEFVEGRTLAQEMSGAPLPNPFVLSTLTAAADALDYAHSRNIVHRDVKPANFLIATDGRVKIADFGIAKIAGGGTNITSTGTVVGTAQYMSPEQVYGRPVSGRSDQFSLAVIAYELLAGRKPFQGDSWASLLHQIANVEAPLITEHREALGRGVADVLQKALSKDPASRYESCRAFVSSLASELGEPVAEKTLVLPPSRTQKTPVVDAATATMRYTTGSQGAAAEPPKRPDLRRAAAAGAILAIALLGAWILFRAHSRQPEPNPTVAVAPQTTPAGSAAGRQDAPATAPSAEPSSKSPATHAASTPANPPASAAAPALSSVRPVPNSAAPVTPSPSPAATVQTPPAQQPAIAPQTAIAQQPAIAPQPPGAQQPPPQTPAVQSAPVQTAPTRAEPTAPPKPAAPSRPTEAEAWNQVAASSDVNALQQFRQNYPNGEHFAAAAQRIEQLDWEKAERTGDAKSIRDFLSKYPAGAFSGAARANLAKLDQTASDAAARALVTAALGRYRTAFENKDADGLKAVWPSLSRAELSSFQNFFGIARSIKLDLQPLAPAEISGNGATLRCRRVITAADNRGPLPVQDQVVVIHFNRSGDAMTIQSIDVGR